MPIPSAPYLVAISLLIVAGFFLLASGGLAFSPGPLTGIADQGAEVAGFGSHAEFEGQCVRCHQPFGEIQGELCADCHPAIQKEINNGSGLHGAIPDPLNCRSCHSDHLGREVDIASMASDRFDHDLARFSLVHHQVNFQAGLIQCEDCHAGSDFAVDITSCMSCHASEVNEFMAAHVADFGQECLDCHDGLDRMTEFDHGSTVFPLTGRHSELDCADCHHDGQFEGIQADCQACHIQPEIHEGFFEADCRQCHSTTSWSPAVLLGEPFEHELSTRFSLEHHDVDFNREMIACQSCHAPDLGQFSTETCEACHTQHDREFMEDHLALFGDGCIECHDGVDRMRGFEHEAVFNLDGRHAEIECEECHAENRFRNTPDECSACHSEPTIHQGFFGTSCDYCHTSDGWLPAPLRYHNFPLDHGGTGVVGCSVCHAADYASFSCFGCHEHVPEQTVENHQEMNLSESELAQCQDCHPAGLVRQE